MRKKIKSHFKYEDDSNYNHMDATHLDLDDFFGDPYEKNDHIIVDASKNWSENIKNYCFKFQKIYF